MATTRRLSQDQAPEGYELKHYSVPLPISYQLHPDTTPSLGHSVPSELIIGLHGFTDSAKAVQRRLGDLSTLPAARLFVNGPFPLPVRIEGGYREAYAWYFFDMGQNRVVISPEPAVKLISALVEELGFADVPKTIIGFSQGGFLAPFLAHNLKNVRRIVGIGSGYRVEDYVGLKDVQVIALHGEKDDVIHADRSRLQFDALISAGFKGEWVEFPGLKHTMDEVSRARLLEILRMPPAA